MERELMMTQKKLDETAVKYNKTKDPKYKDQWYKLVEKIYGPNTIKRRIISINSCHKADDGTYVFIGKSKLYGPLRDTKNKTNRLR